MRTILVTGLLFLSPAAWADGASDFKTFCTTCHGDGGMGDGPSAVALNPKPANFTDPAFWNATRTDAYLHGVIKNGGASAGKSPVMPPWGPTLSDAQIDGIIAYLHTLKK